MMEGVEFQAIKTELLRLGAALQSLTEDQIQNAPDRVYGVYVNRLNRLAAVPVPDDLVRRLVADVDLGPAIARISRLKRQNGLRLEVQFAESMMSVPDPWACLEQFVYYPNYLALARMEHGGAGLHAGDRVVFLGSGPLPLSLICLSKQYDIDGVGIEQDGGRAALSEAVIRKLGLERRIRILCGNHFALPLETPCDLIVVGADAAPKAEIFAHLAAILEPGRTISYRIYEKGLRRLFDAASCMALPPEFVEIRRIQPEPPVNNTCIFAARADLPPA
jgi:hypothetical protein